MNIFPSTTFGISISFIAKKIYSIFILIFHCTGKTIVLFHHNARETLCSIFKVITLKNNQPVFQLWPKTQNNFSKFNKGHREDFHNGTPTPNFSNDAGSNRVKENFSYRLLAGIMTSLFYERPSFAVGHILISCRFTLRVDRIFSPTRLVCARDLFPAGAPKIHGLPHIPS